jgi:hypothetical protein
MFVPLSLKTSPTLKLILITSSYIVPVFTDMSRPSHGSITPVVEEMSLPNLREFYYESITIICGFKKMS